MVRESVLSSGLIHDGVMDTNNTNEPGNSDSYSDGPNANFGELNSSSMMNPNEFPTLYDTNATSGMGVPSLDNVSTHTTLGVTDPSNAYVGDKYCMRKVKH